MKQKMSIPQNVSVPQSIYLYTYGIILCLNIYYLHPVKIFLIYKWFLMLKNVVKYDNGFYYENINPENVKLLSSSLDNFYNFFLLKNLLFRLIIVYFWVL